MSRLFDDVSTEYLYINQAVLSGVPLAVVCWFRSDDKTIAQCLFSIADKDNDDDYFVLASYDDSGTNNELYAFAKRAGATGIATTSSGYTVNTWTHACALFVSATDRRILIDGGSKGTGADNVTPASLDKTAIGAVCRSTVAQYASGQIAEVAVYNLSVWPGATNSDKADNFEKILSSLAKGFSPSLFPLGRVVYWPLVRGLNDKIGGYNLTANGTVVAVHPPIVYPSKPSVGITGSVTVTPPTFALALTLQTPSLQIDSTVTPDALALALTLQTPTAGSIITVTPPAFALALTLQTPSIIRDSTVTPDAFELALALLAPTPVVSCIVIPTTLKLALALQIPETGISYVDIPPFMQKDLIDPYSSGAWLWLVEIVVPGRQAKRIARNTEDVVYGENEFDKFNIRIGDQIFSGDGSIPRVTLRVFQDVNRVIENMVNETEGALGAAIKLIRVNEKFLNTPVAALEADYDNLATESDSEWTTFTIGMPNPLNQRIPLRIYSSKTCPWATPSLFKGPRCQYAGTDTFCTGDYEDCYTKGNAVHWGGELGLSPSILKI